jgi:hypothetical protein
MFIPRIFPKTRTKDPACRGRRPRAGRCLQLESLENRTPLSTGLGAGAEAPVIVQTVEVGQFIPRLALAVELTTLATSSSQAAISPDPLVNLLYAPTNALTSQGDVPATVAVGTLAQVPSNAAIGASATAPLSVEGVDPSVASGQRQVLVQRDVEVGNLESQMTDLLGRAGGTLSLAEGGEELMAHLDDGGDFAYMPGPNFPMGPAPLRTGSVASADNDNSDVSYSGPLEIMDSDDGLSTSTTTAMSTGRTTGRPMSFFFTEPSIQVDSSSEVPNTGGLSYLATGGWSTVDSVPSGAVVDDLFAGEESSTEPVSPAAITAGGLSLNILLGGPDAMMRSEPGGLDQVAELVPLPETSLALAAALWSVPSDAPTTAPESDPPSGLATNPAKRPGDPSSWALFMTGTNQALEQTCRDIRDEIVSSRGRQPADENPSGGQDALIEWQGPILPAAHAVAPANEPRSSLLKQTVAFDDAVATSQTEESSPSDSNPGTRVVLGAIPMLSVVSISTMIAGWFWKKRQQSQPSGSRRNGASKR